MEQTLDICSQQLDHVFDNVPSELQIRDGINSFCAFRNDHLLPANVEPKEAANLLCTMEELESLCALENTDWSCWR